MMKESEIEDLIAWGKEENQSDFIEFVCFFRDRREDRKSICVVLDDKTIEGYVYKYNFTYNTSFPDFDFICWIGDTKQPVVLKYTYMNMIKKTGENAFVVETEKGKKAMIDFKGEN